MIPDKNNNKDEGRGTGDSIDTTKSNPYAFLLVNCSKDIPMMSFSSGNE